MIEADNLEHETRLDEVRFAEVRKISYSLFNANFLVRP
jgi:hypothetical protein